MMRFKTVGTDSPMRILMLRALIVCALLATAGSSSFGAAPEQAPAMPVPVFTLINNDLATTHSVVAVMMMNKGLRRPMPGTSSDDYLLPNVIFALYEDGTAIWSGDRVRGGGPLFQGKIDRAKIASMLKGFEEKKYFAQSPNRSGFIILDSAFTRICIRSGNRVLEMTSCHELVGQNMLAPYETSDLRAFCNAWSDVKRNFFSLVPVDVRPTEGLKVVGVKWVAVPRN